VPRHGNTEGFVAVFPEPAALIPLGLAGASLLTVRKEKTRNQCRHARFTRA